MDLCHFWLSLMKKSENSSRLEKGFPKVLQSHFHPKQVMSTSKPALAIPVVSRMFPITLKLFAVLLKSVKNRVSFVQVF